MTADLERPLKRSRTSTPTSINDIESDEDFTDSISSLKSEELEEMPVQTEVVSEVLTKDQQQEKIFKNLRLRRIVKENHGREINQISFHLNEKNYTAPFGIDLNKTFDKRGAVERDDGDTSNILASVGDTQANIYDNEHCGDHLDIMSHFLLSEDRNGKATASQELFTCCWLHRDDDALLAVAGQDSYIHILSVACSKELRKLEGHTGAITDLQVSPKDDQHILSASKDGTVRLWHVDSEKCLCVYNVKASVVCFNPSGTSFLTGGYNGDIREWTIPDLTETSELQYIDQGVLKMSGKKHHGGCIDCMKYIGSNILSKSVNGKAELWNSDTLEVVKTFHLRNSAHNRCRFDVSMDNKFFCVGSSVGAVYIYNIETGKMVTELRHRRSTKAVRCCVFSRDCRNVVCAGEDSFIWRYDYVDDETLKEWTSKKST
ncbi:hypothetical protein K7432_007803 [Basidiobolus ranarum]|uniref:Uncharacterized protein n=1 Tax=Basidiobolus ranarum TaxID=34480 RepID=A0ABR2VZL1_9FUNG